MAVPVFSSLKIFFKRKIASREGLICAQSLNGTVDLESVHGSIIRFLRRLRKNSYSF